MDGVTCRDYSDKGSVAFGHSPASIKGSTLSEHELAPPPTFILPRNLGEILDYSPLLHVLVLLILFSKYLLNHLLTLPTATTLVHLVHASQGLSHITATF